MNSIPIIRRILCFGTPQSASRLAINLVRFAHVTSSWYETVAHFHTTEMIFSLFSANPSSHVPSSSPSTSLTMTCAEQERDPQEILARFAEAVTKSCSKAEKMSELYRSFFVFFYSISQKRVRITPQIKNFALSSSCCSTDGLHFSFVANTRESNGKKGEPPVPHSILRLAIKCNNVALCRLLVKDFQCLSPLLLPEGESDFDPVARAETSKENKARDFARQNALLAVGGEFLDSDAAIINILVEFGQANVNGESSETRSPGLSVLLHLTPAWNPVGYYCQQYCKIASSAKGQTMKNVVEKVAPLADVMYKKIERLLELGARTDRVQRCHSASALLVLATSLQYSHRTASIPISATNSSKSLSDVLQGEAATNYTAELIFRVIRLIMETEKTRREGQEKIWRSPTRDSSALNDEAERCRSSVYTTSLFTKSLDSNTVWTDYVRNDMPILKYLLVHVSDYLTWVQRENEAEKDCFKRMVDSSHRADASVATFATSVLFQSLYDNRDVTTLKVFVRKYLDYFGPSTGEGLGRLLKEIDEDKFPQQT